MTPPDSVIHKARLTPIASLKPHPRNYHGHPDEQVEHLDASISEHGFYRNIVVARDGTILAGHGIVEAARRRGMTRVPATHLDVAPDDPEALKILAGDNELARLAIVDDATLNAILREVAAADALFGTGFDADALEARLRVEAALAATPLDPNEEWTGLPAFEQGDKNSAYRVTIHFRAGADADAFFKLIERPKASSMWWPTPDDHVGSDVHAKYVEDRASDGVLNRDMLPELLDAAAAEGVDPDWLREAATTTLTRLTGPDPEIRDVERRWYASLDAGEPDYGVYDDDEYLAEAWACWRIYSRKYLRAIRDALDLGSVESVADLGCGVGLTTAALSEMFPSAIVTGTNLDSVQARIARRLAERYGFRVEPTLATIGHADVVFASEFFEHIEQPITYLASVLDTLTPRVLLVANTFGQRAIGHFDSYLVEGERLDGAATSRRFGQILRSRGYERVETKFWNNRPAYWRAAA